MIYILYIYIISFIVIPRGLGLALEALQDMSSCKRLPEGSDILVLRKYVPKIPSREIASVSFTSMQIWHLDPLGQSPKLVRCF